MSVGPLGATPELKDKLIAALATGFEPVDPCAQGHVDHDEAAHRGRELVHTFSPRLFGADWEADDAREFIRGADAFSDQLVVGRHVWARRGDKMYAFEVKEGTVWP